ncbi:MAG: hypothetical protein Q9166_006441 [cf. Caloplaca sp. 2 TL-2023]
MPQFSDLLFPLGEREIAQDFYSDNFYQQTSLHNAPRGLYVPELARSGLEFSLCYSLKSVERSESQTDWPWSVRHCALYHSFDVASVRSNWVVVKGNQLMEKRITAATSGRGSSEFSSYGTIENAFASALATHLIMVDWSAENWRWYINFLEDQFEQLTQGIISKNADVPTQAMEAEDIFAMVSRTNTQISRPGPRVGTFSSRIFPASSRRANTTPTVTEMQPLPAQQYHINPRSGKKQPLPPGRTIVAAQPPNKPTIEYDNYGQQQFKFRHLQQVQSLEESANATVLVLKSNQNICEQIRTFYRSLLDNHELSGTGIEQSCQKDIVRFERSIFGAASQMNAQVLRVEALLRLIANRKNLLYGLLEFQNTKSNRLLASESQKSTRKMEIMTNEMSEIARKTKTETVSMKIITLVTLFFLPGTFIATLMSTDIVHWSNGRKKYQAGALQVYLAICLPLMACTFIVWLVLQWREKRKEDAQNEQARASLA